MASKSYQELKEYLDTLEGTLVISFGRSIVGDFRSDAEMADVLGLRFRIISREIRVFGQLNSLKVFQEYFKGRHKECHLSLITDLGA